jgi:hypothetical protein
MEQKDKDVKHWRKISFMKGLIFLMVLCSPFLEASGQENLIAPKYLKIKPIIDDRSAVERLLGERDVKRAISTYRTEQEAVTITYSDGDCNTKTQEWGIPEGYVEEIFYEPRSDKQTTLNDVITDLSQFKSRQTSDVVIHRKYFNDEAGIVVVFDTKRKSVVSITVGLTSSQKEAFKCRNRNEGASAVLQFSN